jgi:hypothetical protein
MFQTSMSQLKILDSSRVTLTKFHTEDQQILAATLENFVTVTLAFWIY